MFHLNINIQFEPAWTWDFIILQLQPWIMSAVTVWMTLLAGSTKRSAWLFGLFNQFLWLVWILYSGSHNFIFMNIALWIVYFRNNRLWMKKSTP